MAYRDDREWSDRMVPLIKAIVGPRLLDVSSLEQDKQEATDLIVFHARDMRIAARVRRYGYAYKYPHQFTIRCRRDSGAETELSKIVNGWGDWFFYGHANECAEAIEPWWLIDLASFRAALVRENVNGSSQLTRGDRSNGDGTYFKWFDIRSFPKKPPILIASSYDGAGNSGQARGQQQELFHEH